MGLVYESQHKAYVHIPTPEALCILINIVLNYLSPINIIYIYVGMQFLHPTSSPSFLFMKKGMYVAKRPGSYNTYLLT